MKRELISEEMVAAAAKRGEKSLSHSPDAMVTDAAKDRARLLGIKLVTKVPGAKTPSKEAAPPPPGSAETIAIGSDHGGFALKETLKTFLTGLGYNVVDLGTYTEEACDYPDYAYAVGRMVALRQAAKGIMIDAVGIASAMVANKIRGVRAAACTDEFSARSSREHNNANVLTLGGRTIGTELAKSIAQAWLSTNFGGGRHQKRIDKITEIEQRIQSNG